MNCRYLKTFLLLPLILFIQCSTAETNGNEKEEAKSHNNIMDTGTANNNSVRAFAGTDNSLKETNNGKSINSENEPQAGFKQLNFGFNIGYLSGLQNRNKYAKALAQIKKDGITDIRVYEPFSKNNARNPEYIADLLKPVANAGFHILLDFSNFPFDSSGVENKNQFATTEHAAELKYTNRFAPSDLNKYALTITRVLNNLKAENIIQNFSFEIGNEPDAKKYFWGDAGSFNRIAKLAKTIFTKYSQPVYCCAFTTEFAVKNRSYDKNFLDLLDNNEFFNNINLSFHFYPNQKYNFNDITLPHKTNAIISEFNIYSYQKQDNQNRIQYTNSAALGKWLSELLRFTYNNNIKTVYLFNLMDDPKKNGALGFFDADGNPKPSYNYFIKFYNIIKNGYRVEENNNTVRIIGTDQTIIYSGANSNFKSTRSNKNMDANSWKIINNK